VIWRETSRETSLPNAAKWEKDGWIADDAVVRMGKLGLLGMIVPEEWGGSYTDYIAYALAVEEIAVGCAATAAMMCVHNSVACGPILHFGRIEQKRAFLSDMARGSTIGCFCLTEPQAGSEASNLRTRAVRENGHWVLNGNKQFVTNGKRAKLAIVFAVSDPHLGKRGISAFIVPTDSPGFIVNRLERKLGIRASDTCAITLDRCTISEELLLGERGRGLAMRCPPSSGRIGIAARAVGIARAAFEAALVRPRPPTVRSSDRAVPEHRQHAGGHAYAINAARLLTHPRRECAATGSCLSEASQASCSPRKSPSGSPRNRSRSTAATATSRTTRWSGITAMQGSRSFTKVRARFSAC
jgi:hypothetical protein